MRQTGMKVRANRAASGRVRMLDVAREAGVSAQTVSRVLRLPETVAEATRRRVLGAIEKLNYVPDLTASYLASNRSRVVALVLPSVSMSIFADTVAGLTSSLDSAGYQLLLAHTDYSLDDEEAAIRAFLGRRPDAMVLTGVEHSARAEELLRLSGIPVVQTWALTDNPIDMVVGCDNVGAGFAMGEYFIERGYRRLAFAGTNTELRSRQRLEGFARALAGKVAEPLVVGREDLTRQMDEGAAAVDEVLRRQPDTDAVFVASDALAAGAIFECRRRGVRVPDDIAIAGFGGYEIARHITPGLTTAEVSGRRIGELAAQLIVTRLAGKALEQDVVDVGFRIVQRDSA
ncbi:MAG: LacI family DNA-binding transcriptional regulator [Alphaproteobacteria bacterium]|nr:LacI family DNA-binding transcriptional regulator [Alphaproteobacteria bacterium]